MWKTAAERLHQAFAHRARKASEAVTLSIGRITRISGEQLIAAVAGEDNLDVLAREFRNHVRGDRGRISERLVEVPDQFVDHLTNIRSYHELVMLGAEFLRRQARVLQLVITILLETN